jgi:excisionase family DNA binding protein
MDDNKKSEADKLMTYKQASDYLGLPYFKIQRAAARGDIPSYSIMNGRRYVKLSDIEAHIRVHN